MVSNYQVIDKARSYGAQISDSQHIEDMREFHTREREDMGLEQFLEAGGVFTRIRILAQAGWGLDISYVYGVLPDGIEVRLSNGGLNTYRVGTRTYRSEFAKQVKEAGGTYRQSQQMWDQGSLLDHVGLSPNSSGRV